MTKGTHWSLKGQEVLILWTLGIHQNVWAAFHLTSAKWPQQFSYEPQRSRSSMQNDKVYTSAPAALISLSRYSTLRIKEIHE
ncbi:hypothetical protein BJV77DRAFT_190214 [Russula vinacea]|nr:hypothetical protein BJV77DRAFT_190214 [Russula vinacea]